VRSHLDLAAAAAPLDQEILALAPDALLVRRTYPGSVRASGGTFENACLALFAFGAEGLTTRVEWFDPDQEAEALARFAELPRVAPAATRIENAATRLSDRSFRLFEPGDLDATAGLFAPGFRAIDRFTGYLESDADRHLDGIRSVLEGRDVLRRESETIATRGERLALMRQLIAVSGGDVGPSEIEYLIVVETDAPGERFALLVFFGLDDLEAAYEELEARYDAGEAAPYAGVRAIWKRFPSSWRARDWDGLAATFAPELRIEDHRKLGTLSALTREQWIESARALAEMRPDTTLRLDHALALDERRSLSVVCWLGSEAQGAFEIPLIVVSEHHGSGAIRCWHAYDLDQLDEARARYDAIGASAPPDPLAALLRPNGR
jgi:hypothetical protein